MAKKCYIPNVKYQVLKTGNHWECQEFKKGEHNGEDLLNRTPSTKNVACSIIAIDDGTVTVVKKTKTRGNYVEIQHQLGISRYLHMKDNSIKVSVGQKVKRGQVLGTMGTTGDSTGIHLHLAVLIHGEYVDPYEFIIGLKILNLKEGNYKLTENKYIRATPEVTLTNKVKYKNVRDDLKGKFIKDNLGYARYKIGATAEVREFKKDKKGNWWAKTLNTWFCIFDKNGYQAIYNGD